MKEYYIIAAELYLGGICIILFWMLLKTLTSDARLIRKQTTANEQFAEIDNPDCVVILVHGTWALGSEWHHPKSKFTEELENELRQLSINSCQYVQFLWIGGNSVIDRRSAIVSLRLELYELQNSYKNKPIFIIAHSHGGNVAIRAMLDNNPLSMKQVIGVCCVATPFILNNTPDSKHRNGREKTEAIASRIVILLAPIITSIWLLQESMWLQKFNSSIISISYLLGIIAFLALGMRLSQDIASTTIPSDGVEDELFKRLLIIRASGDEASAALGGAYILRIALVGVWGAILKKINLAMFPFRSLIEEGLLSQITEEYIKKRLVLAPMLAIGPFLWIRVFDPTLYKRHGIPYIIDHADTGLIFLSVFFLGGIIFYIALATGYFATKIWGWLVDFMMWILYVPIDFVSGFLLMPFAPELVFSLATSSLSAEAAVPRKGGADIGAICQLPFSGRTSLSHTAYDHPDTPRIISNWIHKLLRQTLHQSGSNPAPQDPPSISSWEPPTPSANSTRANSVSSNWPHGSAARPGRLR